MEDVSRAARGDARAFKRLYERHKSRVYGLAFRMMGAEEAAELTQDVFVRVWEKIGTFRGEAAFSTWLHRVAINVILARRSQHATRRSRFIEDEVAIERAPSRPRQTDTAMDFEGAIGKLPEGARQIFLLHDVQGYRHKEIGDRLGITVGTSKAQLHRARMLLRQHLSR